MALSLGQAEILRSSFTQRHYLDSHAQRFHSQVSLLVFLYWSYVEGSENQTVDPLVLEVLSDLSLPAYPLHQPASILNLTAPNLLVLNGRLSQLQAVNSPSVTKLTICLEKETQEWRANQSSTFLRDMKEILSRFPLVKRLFISALDQRRSCQLKMAPQALHWWDKDNEKPPLPQLQWLEVQGIIPMEEVEDWVDLFLNLQDYRSKKGETKEIQIDLCGTENALRFKEVLALRRKGQGN